MNKKVKRVYVMSDEAMVMHAEAMFDALTKDYSIFFAKFAWLDAAYLAGIGNDITAARKVESDFSVKAQNKVTADRSPVMKQAKAILRLLFKYSAIAYPDKKKKQFVFGQDDMPKARNSPAKMKTLLEHAYSFANKNPYKNDLINAGFSQLQIDELQTIAQALNTSDNEHITAKATRPVSTNERVKILNAAFAHIKEINRCAKIIFVKNAAKVKQYKIYP